MNTRANLALYAHNGQLTVVVEIKNKLGTSRKWATQTRRNILAYGGSFNVDYFLIVTPDRLYMWKNAGTELARIPPTYEADMESEFALYFETAGLDSSHVSGYVFELLVATWLSDVARSEKATKEFANDRSWLNKSGFQAAVKDGRIEFEVAA